MEAILGSILDKPVFCMLLTGRPWVSYAALQPQFPHLQNGWLFGMHLLLPSVPSQFSKRLHSVM